MVWISGHALANSAAALEEVVRECSSADGARYFGDLVPRGILIPLRFNLTSTLRLESAVDLYRMSLEIGTRRDKVAHIAGDDAAALEWIPDCAAELTSLWSSGRWIPQESIGTGQLFRERLADLAP